MKILLDYLKKELSKEKGNLPSTLFYNEGFLLRLILDKYASNNALFKTVRMPKTKNWFSEAVLRTPFNKHEGIRENHTYADAIIGEFNKRFQSGIDLSNTMGEFFVIEAKVRSDISRGVTNSENSYTQISRNIACLYYEVLQSGRRDYENFGFYVFAPEWTINHYSFKSINRDVIVNEVINRDNQFSESMVDINNFSDFVKRITIKNISWETLIADMTDETFRNDFNDFYHMVLEVNKMIVKVNR